MRRRVDFDGVSGRAQSCGELQRLVPYRIDPGPSRRRLPASNRGLGALHRVLSDPGDHTGAAGPVRRPAERATAALDDPAFPALRKASACITAGTFDERSEFALDMQVTALQAALPRAEHLADRDR
jgi:hypothetical protein